MSTWEEIPLCLCLPLCLLPSMSPCAHRTRRLPSIGQEELSSELDHANSLISDFQPPELEKKMNVYCLSHPTYGVLLWQSELINTHHFLQVFAQLLLSHWGISSPSCLKLQSHLTPALSFPLSCFIFLQWIICHIIPIIIFYCLAPITKMSVFILFTPFP